jgi:hypothetical protein
MPFSFSSFGTPAILVMMACLVISEIYKKYKQRRQHRHHH